MFALNLQRSGDGNDIMLYPQDFLSMKFLNKTYEWKREHLYTRSDISEMFNYFIFTTGFAEKVNTYLYFPRSYERIFFWEWKKCIWIIAKRELVWIISRNYLVRFISWGVLVLIYNSVLILYFKLKFYGNLRIEKFLFPGVRNKFGWYLAKA